VSINSPAARLGGWRYKHYQTRKELKDEIRDLEKIKTNLKKKNKEAEDYIYDLEITLGVIAEIARPTPDEEQ